MPKLPFGRPNRPESAQIEAMRNTECSGRSLRIVRTGEERTKLAFVATATMSGSVNHSINNRF